MLDLVLLRHGQSTWNAENLFTGWVDVDLTEAGEAEARAGGELLAAETDLDLQILHTSLLTRAIRTAELALAAAKRSWLPVRRDWRLNERHYGDLQGKNTAENKAEFGEAQLLLWRRSYDTPPPPLAPDNPWTTAADPRYRGLDPALLPATECLAVVDTRVVPYWESSIVPDLRQTAASGGAVLVAAHGNSIRALRKPLEGIADDDITGLEIPTGIPYRCRLDDDLSVVSAEYLGDAEAAAEAAAAVGRQADRPVRLAPENGERPGRLAAPRPLDRYRTVDALQRVCPAFSGAYPHHRLDGDHPHLAVTDLPGGGRGDDGVHDLVALPVVDEDLDADLGDEVHLIFRTSVHLGVTPLTPEPLSLGQGHPLDPEVLQDLLDVIELERLEDSYHELHPRAPFACWCTIDCLVVCLRYR